MRVVDSVNAMRQAIKAARRASPETIVGLVPTMGALHAGHISLVRAARASCDLVVATIFVNPLQFGPREDYAKYPRTFEQDCKALAAEGVDLVFAPSPEEMYPPGAETIVDVPGLGSRLDGASRPGHFRGVATVVAKLFHIVQPDRAFFGQKDAAQVAVLRTMVRDLNFDLELITCPIVREPDGLAMSSRNVYLNAEERSSALALHRALTSVERDFQHGNRDVEQLRNRLQAELDSATGIRRDYAEIVDRHTLEPVSNLHRDALVAVAAWAGPTRLIDNIVLPAEEATP